MLNIFIIGFGDVGSNKLYPNLVKEIQNQGKNKETQIIILDIKPENTVREKLMLNEIDLNVRYISNPNGFSSQDIKQIYDSYTKNGDYTVTYISSPNKTHSKYILSTIPLSNLVLVEKPLVEKLDEIDILERELNEMQLNKVRMIDHYIFKDAVRELLIRFKDYSEGLKNLQKVEFYLLEEKPIRESRAWLYKSGLIRDLLPHFLSIIMKLVEGKNLPLDINDIRVKNVYKAKYDESIIPEEYRLDAKETFAIIELQSNNIPMKVTIGKGVGVTKKELILEYENGKLKLNTVNNTIETKIQGRGIKTYKKPIEKYHEYSTISKEILKGNRELGISYNQAKIQMKIIKETDKYQIEYTYKLNTLPKI